MSAMGYETPNTARQLTAIERSPYGERYVRLVSKDWIRDFSNLYNSSDECANRDYAIIKKLGEVYDPQTANELKFLLDHVDEKVRQEYINTFLVKDDLAECTGVKIRSPSTADFVNGASMTMEVRYVGHTEKKQPTSGRLRLFLRKDGRAEQVEFGRRAACILYLIYMLDIYQAKNTARLDISNYRLEFCRLFYNVYAYGGSKVFNTITGKGNSKQKMLRHYMSDIRHAIGQTCELLHEDASPYILSKEQPYLNVQKHNIVIDERLTKHTKETDMLALAL